MGKNQSASNLTNIIQYNNGNISFVSGSTTLMQISSSGAITITGVISGSTTLSSSFATTASYAVSATSASYSLNSTSASYALNATSASNSTLLANRDVAQFATTASNVYYGNQIVSASVLVSGSITATGQIVAQTINVQSVTSSIVYSSGSNVFGNKISDTQTFTGSMLISGSVNAVGAICTVGTVCAGSVCAPSHIGGTFSGTVIYGSSAICGGVISGSGALLTGALSGTSATFSSSVGTTALNMNNMASLGSIGGGSIYLPYTAVIMFRTTDGATARAKITADNSNNLFLNSDGGSVGIGTSSPSAELQVNKNCDAVVAISNCIGVITGNRGSLAFYNCATSTVGLIRAAAVTDNVGTELQFHTRPAAGNLSQTMTITSDGYVAVVGNQGLKCVPYLQGMSFGWNRSNGQGESMINWTNAGGGTACDLVFNFRDSTTLYERLRLSSAGTLYFGIGAGSYEQMTLCYSGYNGGSPITTLMPSTVPGSGALTTFLLLKSNGLGLASGCNQIGRASCRERVYVLV